MAKQSHPHPNSIRNKKYHPVQPHHNGKKRHTAIVFD